MAHTTCPSCGREINFYEKLQAGQNTVCPKCKELLVVQSLDPLTLELYTFVSSSDWINSDKQEAAKRHERRSKHRVDEIDEDFEEENWRKGSKKTRNRNRSDW